MNRTRPSSIRISRLFQTLAKMFACLLLTAGLAGGVGTASAQSTPTGTSADAEAVSAQWLANFDLQAAHQLRQAPTARTSLLQVVVKQASNREDLHLPRTAEALLHVIEHDSSEQRRLMAIQALSAIGPEHIGQGQYDEAMSRLYTLAKEESSEQVRGAAADVISRYKAG